MGQAAASLGRVQCPGSRDLPALPVGGGSHTLRTWRLSIDPRSKLLGMLGSTSGSLLHVARCPLAIVRH